MAIAIVAIVALNLGVLLMGCLLAAYRTWGPGAGGHGSARDFEDRRLE